MKTTLIAIAVIALASFGWWTLSPLFVDKEVDDELPAVSNTDTQTPKDTDDSEGTAATSEATEEPSTSTEGPFAITDTTAHPASGNVFVVRTPEETIVRYENYDGTNGPDLHVYLAKDLEANEFVDLGVAKGNKGNINYTVPEGVDIDEYPYVLTWCKAFGVLFDSAKIN